MVTSAETERYRAIEPVPHELVALVTGRQRSMFNADIAASEGKLLDTARAARILVVGAAGSIGSAFVRALLDFEPREIALLDIDENGLADLVRDLRSGGYRVPERFSTAVIGLGTLALARFLGEHGPFDIVLNFAALKHVRSERDPFSLMRMIETNVLGVAELLGEASRGTNRLFSVSSDKAVWPSSLMGATKRWMEVVLAQPGVGPICTSARFANVAFSAGSLLSAFLDRLHKRQPIAAPSNVRRFFISHGEAAQLCLLAAFLGGRQEVFLPRLDAARDAISLDEVACRVLSFHGFKPLRCAGPEEALHFQFDGAVGGEFWPCYFAPSDTSGEKELEELSYPAEPVERSRFENAVVARLASSNRAALATAGEAVARLAQETRWRKEPMIEIIRSVVPELRHVERHASLDEKL